MHIVDLQVLFSVAALLNLVFSLMPLAVFVLPLDESLKQGRNRSGMLTCVIPVVLLSTLTCLLNDVVFFFSSGCCSSLAQKCDISGTHVVSLVVLRKIILVLLLLVDQTVLLLLAM